MLHHVLVNYARLRDSILRLKRRGISIWSFGAGEAQKRWVSECCPCQYMAWSILASWSKLRSPKKRRILQLQHWEDLQACSGLKFLNDKTGWFACSHAFPSCTCIVVGRGRRTLVARSEAANTLWWHDFELLSFLPCPSLWRPCRDPHSAGCDWSVLLRVV